MIIVRGRSNVGKSSAISFAYEQMKNVGIQVLFEGYKPLRKRKSGPPEVWAGILKINEVLVGFSSPGDTPEHLDRCLKPLIEKKCLVIVGATRPLGHASWRRAEELASMHCFQIVPLDKTALSVGGHTANQIVAYNQANQAMAANMIVPAIWDGIAKAKSLGPVEIAV